jgi:hypothetical protein
VNIAISPMVLLGSKTEGIDVAVGSDIEAVFCS